MIRAKEFVCLLPLLWAALPAGVMAGSAEGDALQRIEVRCAQDPARCQEMKAQYQERKARRDAWCAENPEQMRARMERCRADPEACRARRQGEASEQGGP